MLLNYRLFFFCIATFLLLIISCNDEKEVVPEVVYKGFETGDFSEWTTTLELEALYHISKSSFQPRKPFMQSYQSFSTDENYSHQIESEIVREGMYSGRFEIRPGDRDLWNPSTIHTEVLEEYTAPIGDNADTVWYGWSVYLPVDFPGQNEALRGIFSQFHATKDDRDIFRSPNLAFRYSNDDGTIDITIRYSDEKFMMHNDGTQIVAATFTPNYGEWNDFIVEVKWTWTNQGYCRIWHNENLLVDYAGPTSYNDDLGTYFRCGLYQDLSDYIYINYCDEYRRGYSYNSVNPNR